MAQFNPNDASTEDSGIFGLPYSELESKLIFLPLPWEVTTSYGGGTAAGPEAILKASRQVDLFDIEVVRPYEAGLFLLPESEEVREWNKKGKALASEIIKVAGHIDDHPHLQQALDQVNHLGDLLNNFVYTSTRHQLKSNKIVGILGGDHSVPYGAYLAISEIYPEFGILHFDAHLDTRKQFEGFKWSHASIMYNVLETIPQVTKLVQVGMRDFCEEEINYIHQQGDRVKLFTDFDLSRKKFKGITWNQISTEIISQLPDHVWISFDIDGFDPRLCPHTGTPVPGGLDFQEVNYLLSALVHAGKKIIGFDLDEVAPNLIDPLDSWDANVGARLLYKLSTWTLASQKIVPLYSDCIKG